MGLDLEKYSQRTRHGRWMQAAGQAGLASIIIPTFNRASLLDEAIASSVNQIYRPLEMIVVDDGSVDDTHAVVERWRREITSDLQLSIRYCQQANSGVGSARNHGLIECRGEFIQFLDSDDLLHPEKLRLHIACLQAHPDCGYIFSDWKKFETPQQWTAASVDRATEIDSAELYCSLRVHWVMLGAYRRQICFGAGPFCEDLVSGEDKEYNLRVLLSTEKVVYLPAVLCASRSHSGGRITDSLKVAENKLNLTLRRLERMTESAIEDGRLNNRPLVRALVKDLSTLIVDSLESGRADLATEAIGICRTMPIGRGRRIRLRIYRALGLLSTGAFRRLWRIWLRVRRAGAGA